MSVQKVLLCPFHCKPRPSRVSLESLGLENILLVPGNGAEVDENYDARNGLSAILLVLNLSGTLFRPRSSKVCLQKLVLCEFHFKPWPSGVSLESLGLENIPQVPEYRPEVSQNHDARTPVSATL